MAHTDSWPGIAAHGLLSTSALLDLFEVSGEKRYHIESDRRPDSVVITHPGLGRAVIRDNKPMSDTMLARCLVDVDPPSYYRLLNRRAFFWLTEQRLETLLSARAYRYETHLVITVETSALLKRHADAVTLSAINSGSTAYRAMPRGNATFVPLPDYDYEARRRLRGSQGAIAELAVEHGLDDVLEIALRAERRSPDGSRELLWRRGGVAV
jgi:hypothetical protein